MARRRQVFLRDSWSPPRYNYPRFASARVDPQRHCSPASGSVDPSVFSRTFRRALLEFNLAGDDGSRVYRAVSAEESRVLYSWPPFVPAFFGTGPFVSPATHMHTRVRENTAGGRGERKQRDKERLEYPFTLASTRERPRTSLVAKGAA